MSGFPRGSGTTTAADIEATFTAAQQLYVGTGAGTGVLSSTTVGNATLNSLGVGVAASGVAGYISVGNVIFPAGGTVGFNANEQITFGNNNGVINITAIAGLQIVGTMIPETGLQISSHASVTNPIPVSGTPFTPNATYTTFVLITADDSVAGSVAVTMGPTTGAENVVTSAVNLTTGAGTTVGFICPNGWKVVVTTTGTVTLSSSVTVL